MTETTHENVVEHEHRSPAQYVMIAVILCVLTAMEIALYYLEATFSTGIIVTALIGIAAIKFFLVAAYFMHLKDDPKLFRRWFIVGGASALLLFFITLVTLHFQDYRFF